MALNTPGPRVGAQAPAGAPGPDASQAALAANMRRVARRYPLLHPRWPLLAAMIFMPLAIVGEGIKLYYSTNHCTIGGLCSLDTLPGIVQALLIWIVYFVIWFVVALVAYPIEDEQSQLGPTAAFLRRISNYLAIGPLVAVYAVVALLELIVSLWIGRIDPTTMALCVILVFVGGCLLAPRRPQRALSNDARRAGQIGRASTLSFRARNLPFVRRFVQPRNTQGQNTQAGAPPPPPA